MSLHHLFCNNLSIADESSGPFEVLIDPTDRDHVKALRLRPGEHIALIDASHDYFEVEVVSIKDTAIRAQVSQRLDATDTIPPVNLVQGLAKGDKNDTVLRAATELGISAFYPAAMQRSIIRYDERKAQKRLERFRSIARNASSQSGRTTIPDVQPIRSLLSIAEILTESDAVLLFWEEAPLDASLDALFSLSNITSTPNTFERYWLIVGPEGGISPEEVARVVESDARVFPLSLGPNILRTETAGIVATALTIDRLRSLCRKEAS